MSKTPRTDDFVECYATGMNREVAPHHKFMRVADFARQLEAENAEMAELLRRYLDTADKPAAQAKLADIDAEARALLARVEGK